jgi:hypothetical protein
MHWLRQHTLSPMTVWTDVPEFEEPPVMGMEPAPRRHRSDCSRLYRRVVQRPGDKLDNRVAGLTLAAGFWFAFWFIFYGFDMWRYALGS